MITRENIEIGDNVFVDSTVSILGGGGIHTVKDIIIKYNEDTGEPYEVIVLENGWQFYAKNGRAKTGHLSRYLSHKVKI